MDLAKNKTAAELQAAAEVEKERVETSGHKVELLRGFLQLADGIEVLVPNSQFLEKKPRNERAILHSL